MGRLDSLRRRSRRNQAIPAAAANERMAVTIRDRGRSLPAGTIPPSADTVTPRVAVSVFPAPSVARARMVWSPSVKLIVAVHEAVPEALLHFRPSVLTSTNASPTLSDAFPVTTVGPAGREAPATGERIWIEGFAVSGPRPDAFGVAATRALRGPSPTEFVAATS